MADATRSGLGILGAAFVMGALGDGLLRAVPWGLNLLAWVGALVAVIAALARWRHLGMEGDGRWLVVPALFFSAAVAWRDSPTLVALNVLALLVAAGLAASRARAGQLREAGVMEYGRGLATAVVEAVGGVLVLVSVNIRWREIPRGGWSSRLLAVGRGLAIAIPPTLVFGSLFVAADAAFAGVVNRLFGWDPRELLAHLAVAAFWAWPVGGYLRRLLIATGGPAPVAEQRGPGLLGSIEMGVSLGMLNALFLAFVLVQLRYLFGGAALVEASTNLSYAEYARRGFFELVAVAALVLPLLLLADWAVRKESRAQERLFRALVGALVALLFVIMASAVQRMWLYQEEFGLTELRLYTTAFIGWLALVFVWFVLTVLRGRRERFVLGALAAGFAVVAVLDVLNPDALIVRTNADRRDARPFDGRYAASLSADAVPALVQVLPTLDDDERRFVTERVLARWSPSRHADWRTWSWGRWQAWRALGTLADAPTQPAAPGR